MNQAAILKRLELEQKQPADALTQSQPVQQLHKQQSTLSVSDEKTARISNAQQLNGKSNANALANGKQSFSSFSSAVSSANKPAAKNADKALAKLHAELAAEEDESRVDPDFKLFFEPRGGLSEGIPTAPHACSRGSFSLKVQASLPSSCLLRVRYRSHVRSCCTTALHGVCAPSCSLLQFLLDSLFRLFIVTRSLRRFVVRGVSPRFARILG